MVKITFVNEEMAKDYINGLFNSGLRAVNEIENIADGKFCVIGNNVYFVLQ